MKIYQNSLNFNTSGSLDILDVTPNVTEELTKSKISDGFVNLFIPGSTAAVTTIEYESGALNDLRRAIERMAPRDITYEHDRRWGDGNGFSHVRAALLGPSLTIPVENGRLILGTWQQLVLLELDNRPRTRKLVVKIVGS